MPSTVLILAAPDDGESWHVTEELRRRGHRPVLFDLSDFPHRASLDARLGPTGWDGRLSTPDTSVELADITAVYHRRCPPFDLPEAMTDDEQRFARVEGRFGLGGVLAGLPAHWVSHPSAVADAEYKPVQYAAAARVGLTLPPTWIGNTPDAARAFLAEQGGSGVYKPLMHKLVSDQGQARLIYTTPTGESEIDERVSATTHQFQQRISTACDVRALITRTRCEAVAIKNVDGSPPFVDYRAHYDALAYERTLLEPDTIVRAQRLLTELGLASGVFDFAMTAGGRTIYYEVNPAGQWAWLMEATGAPMTQLICDELTGTAT